MITDKTKTLDEVFTDAYEYFSKHGEVIEPIEIAITYIWTPDAVDNWQYIYDEEYSFRGTQEDYKEWQEDYFTFDDIDPQYISYSDPTVKVYGEPDVSILYLRDM